LSPAQFLSLDRLFNPDEHAAFGGRAVSGLRRLPVRRRSCGYHSRAPGDCFLRVNRGMSKHYQEQAKFSLAKSYFQIVLKQDSILPQHLKTTEDVAASLFGIEKEPDESGKGFLNRLAKRFEISLPKELHFEEERSPG
jgi:hypothetical protein